MVTKLYLVRHAEAEGNAVPFFQGSMDTALTGKGRTQLIYLAERFRHVPLDAIYYSPYRRAKQTAEAVNQFHGLPMIPEAELRELGGGSWEGEKSQTCRQAPAGEAMRDVYARMCRVMQKIAAENPGRTFGVFTHGCALRNFLSFLESGSINGLPAVGWGDNSAVSLAEYDPASGWRLVYKNDSSHLPQDTHTAMPV